MDARMFLGQRGKTPAPPSAAGFGSRQSSTDSEQDQALGWTVLIRVAYRWSDENGAVRLPKENPVMPRVEINES